jgi:hypothetical protein
VPRRIRAAVRGLRSRRGPNDEEQRPKPGIDAVWSRIVAHEGATFHQIRGKPFTYECRGRSLVLSTTNQIISMSQLEAALSAAPFVSTAGLQHLRAPSYLYAILMDPRIRQKDW